MDMTSPCSPSGFERLPADLYHEIFSYLPEPSDQNKYSYVTNEVYEDELHVLDYLKGVGRDFGKSVPQEYLELRLVSRAFNLSIVRIWFQHEFLLLRALDYCTFVRKEGTFREFEYEIMAPNSVSRIDEFIQQGQLLPHMLRRIRLELSTCPKCSYKYQPWLEPDNSASRPEDRESLFAFLRVFPSALEKMEHLQCLWLDLKEEWKSDGYETRASQLDLGATDELRKSLCSLFSPSYAHKFSFLTDLRLVLPCTYDFAALNGVMSNEATGRLRHLYLEYVDATGPGGHDVYISEFGESRGDEDDDEMFPRSNLQEAYSNYDYMSDICKLISRCTNLESLGLHATHYLDLDDLDWKPAGPGLRSIYIHRAIVHFDTLKKLLGAADGNPSNIVAIKLSEVQLLDHTWNEFIKHLCEANALKYFSIVDLNYALRGKSAHLNKFVNMPTERHRAIWAGNQRGEPDLTEIVLRVVCNNGIVGPYLEDTAACVNFGEEYISIW